ncbi:hypothetical protein GCM10010222_51610 [Streptomyces tanashiensis]|nr:hypothetical protein GCM10010222_51610 [Streptomyces tanashiensis]GGY23489.1 hypothetical protein GCM10010299_32060 [Streptomyces tanashiensis]
MSARARPGRLCPPAGLRPFFGAATCRISLSNRLTPGMRETATKCVWGPAPADVEPFRGARTPVGVRAVPGRDYFASVSPSALPSF